MRYDEGREGEGGGYGVERGQKPGPAASTETVVLQSGEALVGVVQKTLLQTLDCIWDQNHRRILLIHVICGREKKEKEKEKERAREREQRIYIYPFS